METARCQVPGCGERVLDGRRCAAGHAQVRGVRPAHPAFRRAIPGEIRAKRCGCGRFVPCERCGDGEEKR